MRPSPKLTARLCAAGLAIGAGLYFRVPALFEIVTLNLKYNLLDQLSEQQDMQRKYLLRYKELTRTTLGATNHYTQQAYLSLARLDLEMGKTDEALSEYQQVLPFMTDPGDVADVLFDIGSVHFGRQDHDTAIEYFRSALTKRYENNLQNDSDTRRLKQTLAISLLSSGRIAEAKTLLGDMGPDAPAQADKGQPGGLSDRASALIEGATLAMLGQKWDDAARLQNEAIEVLSRINGARNPRVAAARAILATLYLQLHRENDAEKEIIGAIDIQKERLGDHHLALAQSYGFYGVICEAQNNPRNAIEQYKQALKIEQLRLPAESAALGETHFNLGRNYQNLQDWQAAYDHFSEAAKIFAAAQTAFGRGHGNQVSLQPQAGEGLLRAAAELRKQTADNSESLVDSTLRAVQAAGRSSAADAISLMSARLQAGDNKLKEKVRQLQEVTGRYEDLGDKFVLSGQAASKAAFRPEDADALENLRKQRDDLTAQLSAEFPAYFKFVDPSAMKLEDIRAALMPDETLVVFSFANNTTYAWAVGKSTPAVWADLKVSGAELDQRVNRLREALKYGFNAFKPPPQRFSLNEAFSLYETLFLPIEPALRTRRLLIVSAGSLATLPLHVLVTAKPPPEAETEPAYQSAFYRTASWLALEKSLVTLPAVQSLRALRGDSLKPSDASQSYIGFGDPVITVPDIKPLTNAAAEIRAAASAYGAPADSIRLGEDASESAVKSLPLSNYRTLHFATHAITSDETQKFIKQNEPALVLTETDSDDGFLTAEEVAALKLNADWVILSACDTASEGDAGGPLSGLARAFFYAGARSVLVSNWEVDDAAASELIVKMIEALAPNQSGSISDDLQKAMRFLINDTANDQYAYPAYWAPFVVVGSRASTG